MFKVETNLDEFKENSLKSLEQLISADKVLREAALDAVALISHRVQQEGKKTDGSPIKATHKKPNTKNITSPYSDAYAAKRSKTGRQIGYVDLTFDNTGMMGDFIPAPDGDTSYVIGFRGKSSSDKADWNEMRFGTIFQLSDSEQKLVQDIVSKKIDAIVNNAG